jgi:hypothetical protein
MRIRIVGIMCIILFVFQYLPHVYAAYEPSTSNPDLTDQVFNVQKHWMLAAFLTYKYGEATGNFGPNNYVCQELHLKLPESDYNINSKPLEDLAKVMRASNDPLTPSSLLAKQLKPDEATPQKKSISSMRCVPFCKNLKSSELFVTDPIKPIPDLLQSQLWKNAMFNPKAPIESDILSGDKYDTDYSEELMDPKSAHACGRQPSESIDLEIKQLTRNGINTYDGEEGPPPPTQCDPKADPEKPCIITVSSRTPWAEEWTGNFINTQVPQSVSGTTDSTSSTGDDETEFGESPLPVDSEENLSQKGIAYKSGWLATMLPGGNKGLLVSYKKALNGKTKNLYLDSEDNPQQLEDPNYLYARNLEGANINYCGLYPSSLIQKQPPPWGQDCYYGKQLSEMPIQPKPQSTKKKKGNKVQPIPPPVSTESPAPEPIETVPPQPAPTESPATSPVPHEAICDPSIASKYKIDPCIIDAIGAIESGGGIATGNSSGCPYSCCNFNATTGLCGCGPMQMDTRQIGAAGMSGQDICNLQTSCEAIARFTLGMKAKSEYGWVGAHYEAGLENNLSVSQSDIESIIGQWYGHNPSNETQSRWGQGATYASAVQTYCQTGSLPSRP